MTSKKSPPSIIPITRHFLLSVVVPVYNEQEVVVDFHRRLSAALKKTAIARSEIIYVNDGSTDESSSLLQQLMRMVRLPG